MPLQLPSTLPDVLHQTFCDAASQCQDGDQLIGLLDTEKIAIPFFRAAFQDKEWMARSDKFLLGRLHELVHTHHTMDLAVRTKEVARPILSEQDVLLQEMLEETTTASDKGVYKARIQQETAELFKEFCDIGNFIELMNTNRFVAGRIFERVRHLHGIHLRAGPDPHLRMQEVFNKCAIYLQKAEFTADDNGFYSLLKYRLPKNFDILLDDLTKIDVPWEAKLLCLQPKTDENGNFRTDLIIADLEAWKSSQGSLAIFGTVPKIRSFQKFLKEIDQQLLVEENDIIPDPSFGSSSSAVPIFDRFPQYQPEGALFNELVEHCRNLHFQKRESKLLRFLYHLPIDVPFKQFLLFQNYEDERDKSKAQADFEVFRTKLPANQQIELYQTAAHETTRSRSSTRLSTSPPSSSSGEDQHIPEKRGSEKGSDSE